jgi:hypothetical protein
MPLSATIQVAHAVHDLPLDLDSGSSLWSKSLPVTFDSDNYGRSAPGMRTVVHSCWTRDNLYLLFVCFYREINLKPQPETDGPTAGLWNWDVAEIFIGADHDRIGRYKEFEISPQGEWLDLDIDLDASEHIGDRNWSSHFEAVAHINHVDRVWCGAMRIPFAAITTAPAQAGTIFRANLFRSQGLQHQLLTWQPPMGESFHVPEKFGQLVLLA